jgi:enoyl-CoA hydratase/carnithine racemase
VALMTEPLVHVRTEGGVARVELDKPPVNAFDLELVQALAEVVRELQGSHHRAVVFSGRGPSLAAGGDIKWMHDRTTERDGKSLRTFFRALQDVFDDIEHLPVPTIAQVHGMTLGGGLEIALACDLRVAADDAQIGFPEATIGLIPSAGGTQRLTEIVGRPLALELMYTGRMLDMVQASALGLVNRVAARDQLAQAVDSLVADVLRSTPAALAAIKSCVRTRIEDGRSAGFRLERSLVEALATDPDAVARLDDFRARRARKPEPQLQGV